MAITDFLYNVLDRNNDGKIDARDFELLFGGSAGGSGFPGVGGGTATVAENARTVEKFSRTDYNNIMGLPPLAYIGDDTDSFELTMNRILQTMLVIELEPCKPQYIGISGDTGLDLFKLETVSKEEYSKLFLGTTLENYVRDLPLRFAVQNDTSFSESWSTEFGESRFEDIANVGSALGQEIKFITGQDDLVKGLGKIIGGVGSSVGSIFGEEYGNYINTLNNAFVDKGTQIETKAAKAVGENLGRGLLSLASGAKIDFPQVWRGSGFSTAYAFTVKLYNPYPNDEDAYIEYILTPLTHLLAFMCPKSESNFTFGFPLLCRFFCPGLAGLEAAYISSMDVIKGGEGNDISFSQRPGTVDIRFSVSPLYNTMIAKAENNVSEERPTLHGYIRHLRGAAHIPSIYTSNIQTINSETIANIGSNNVTNLTPSLTVTPTFNPSNISASISASIIDQNDFNSSRTNLEALDAFSDPLINNLFTSDNVLTDNNIQLIENYRNELITIEAERQLDDITALLEDRVALKIKHGIPLSRVLVNWFWNNIDKFDVTTRNIVSLIEPPYIRPITTLNNNIDSGNFDNKYNLTSKSTITQTTNF